MSPDIRLTKERFKAILAKKLICMRKELNYTLHRRKSKWGEGGRMRGDLFEGGVGKRSARQMRQGSQTARAPCQEGS